MWRFVLSFKHNVNTGIGRTDGFAITISRSAYTASLRAIKSGKRTLCQTLLVMCRRHSRWSCSYFTTLCRSACSPSATGESFTWSDVRARFSADPWLVHKTLPRQPRHVIKTLDRFSSRSPRLQLALSCLTRNWMSFRRWSLSSSASWYVGVSLHLPTFSNQYVYHYNFRIQTCLLQTIYSKLLLKLTSEALWQ